MQCNTTFSNMHRENFSTQNQVNENNFSLFEKNLKRINKNLAKVNEYYSSQNNHSHSVENHSQVTRSEKFNEPFDEKIDESLHFYDELYKIKMNEIEVSRKMSVRDSLNKRVDTWEQMKREFSKIPTKVDGDLKNSVRKRLIIDRSYNIKLLDNRNEQFQTRLREEQNAFDKKKLSIKFALALNRALSIKNEKPVVKSDEFFTFKFNTDKKVNNSTISDFSFRINKDSKHKNNFDDEYKQFLENHLTMQKYLKKIENGYSSFLCNDNLKPLRQELVKAINTPVNSISSVSSWHMIDKFEKLDTLLKCKTVKTGNSTVTANSHPDALIFCKDTLAKKIINIGEQVASVKTETAFEVASIVTELWKIHPDFGILLYARFKQKCPCLIPYNAEKTNEETDEEYYKSLCYNYTNGVVEKQDKYVKRMTGIVRLFAAIIVTESKSGKALDIGQAWMLIAATVRLVPQLDVTAILLHEILMITGHSLKQTYGRQFIKMLEYINSNYIKKIDEVTPVGCGGPVQRLKTFINKVIQMTTMMVFPQMVTDQVQL